jgi:anti-anti-sigma factor
VAILEDGERQAAVLTTTAPPRSEFSVSCALSIAVVTVHGELDRSAGERLSTVFLEVLGDERNKVVVVDLRDVSRLEPSVVSVFWVASSRARRSGVPFRLFRPSAGLADALTGANLGQELDIVP